MNDKGINVLSLFDGMSCGRIALERAGIKVYRYYASEIDKHAIKVSLDNWFDVVQIGSVVDLSYKDGILSNRVTGFSDKVKIDLLIGGSPCQGFSFAGKQLNFDDPRSALFFEYVRLWNEIEAYNPNAKFLLENVKMKKEYEDVITDYMFVKPIEINSALVSAQNRKRLYWTNINGVDQPHDKGLVIRDIVDSSLPFTKNSDVINTHPSGRDMNGKIHDITVKGPCLTTNKGEGPKIGIFNIAFVPGCKRNDRMKIVSLSGKSPCLTAVQGGGQEPKFGSKIESDTGLIKYRKASVLECERLQTVPDNYSQAVSNSRRYHMLGNGWTVDVIVHIFSFYKP